MGLLSETHPYKEVAGPEYKQGLVSKTSFSPGSDLEDSLSGPVV